MAKRVTLDAMIPREDFATEGEEFAVDLFPGMQITALAADSPMLKLLRKPDFQRETNHWSPEQLATFIASFLDNEVIPSLILWKSASFIFVIDGGHRLSALRAWMEDDYGDRPISQSFYNGEIPEEQKRIAKRARALIESKVGGFKTLRDMVGQKTGTEQQRRRADRLFTRAVQVQWIQGSPTVAETSFFKINSQGTPLDDTEEMLIKNRKKPVAIGARAILRAGAGHRYWSSFDSANASIIETLAADFYSLLFEPDVDQPLKTLDVPLGGSVSPVDALALLVDFLEITGSRKEKPLQIQEYADETTGEATIGVLENALKVVRRITGDTPASLGLHPAVYFYNEKGKFSRFLFLGMALLITERLRNNDDGFFKRFTIARQRVESFLLLNKSLVGIVLQNLGKTQRIPKMRDLLSFLVSEFHADRDVSVEAAIAHLGLRGRIIDVVGAKAKPQFSDDTKSMIFIKKALEAALKCPICKGVLDPNKSVSYDHITRVRDGGMGDAENGDLVHHYCNTGMKN